jgi:hypothetical protein
MGNRNRTGQQVAVDDDTRVDTRLAEALRESMRQSARGQVTVCADLEEMVAKILGDRVGD